jgi:hypothetical protein
MPLDLLVADLLLPPDAPTALRATRLPHLEKWLARADAAKSPSRGAAGALASLHGLPAPAPIAAISLAGEKIGDRPQFSAGQKMEVCPRFSWLRADPVHLRIDHDAVKLHDGSILGVSRDEAEELIAALQAHFAPDGLEFFALAPDRWYVRVPEGESPRTTPLPHALGRNVFGLLPEGTGRFNWRSALTEAQMVMSTHAVNARREEEGKLAINSVWFWGEGAAPASVEKRYSLVYANDSFALGLAALSGARLAAPPATLAAVDFDDAVLVAIDTLTPPLNRGDAAAWQQGAALLERDWFATLGDAIERFGEVRVILPADTGTIVATLTPAARWRWFRARKPLTAPEREAAADA